MGISAAINNGYFTGEGIRPVIIPYSGTAGETLISSGKTDLAFTYPPNIPAYRASGLEYRAVAGLTQVNTIELAVLQSSPYTSPAQLSGTLYGGFGVPSDPPIIKAIFTKVGVADPVYREVVLNGSAYQALAAKRVAYTTMFGGIDDVTAELQGAKLRLFPIRDYLGRRLASRTTPWRPATRRSPSIRRSSGPASPPCRRAIPTPPSIRPRPSRT